MTSYPIATEDLREVADAELDEVTGGYDFVFLGMHFFSMPSLASTGSYACSEPAGGGAWSCTYVK
jgi:hypothetical protein